ncbi:MAG: cell division protein SepF [Oscillospiraceae bacterium]|nr:cell division protein SepF [Oscillospiraceae bacterium]MDD7428496.1 cell division protein SepF [Oscillospiraceae bacterium]MDY2847546.1 cell division protein SepF [Oscillospiraceae bacterium]
MGKFIDSFKNFAGLGGYEGEEDEYDDDTAEESEPARPVISRAEQSRQDKQFKMQVTTQLQVILVKPEVFSDTKMIADHLCSKKTVVLNLEATTPEISRRIIDFIGGVAYAKGGNIKPIANNTFIIFPYDVNFEGEDIAAELENNGVVF